MAASKFTRRRANLTAQIDRVIGAAAADDDRQPAHPDRAKPTPPKVTFTMTLPGDMAAAVDQARGKLGLTRLGFIRMAVARALGFDDAE